jgi:hypothetical protein
MARIWATRQTVGVLIGMYMLAFTLSAALATLLFPHRANEQGDAERSRSVSVNMCMTAAAPCPHQISPITNPTKP